MSASVILNLTLRMGSSHNGPSRVPHWKPCSTQHTQDTQDTHSVSSAPFFTNSNLVTHTGQSLSYALVFSYFCQRGAAQPLVQTPADFVQLCCLTPHTAFIFIPPNPPTRMCLFTPAPKAPLSPPPPPYLHDAVPDCPQQPLVHLTSQRVVQQQVGPVNSGTKRPHTGVVRGGRGGGRGGRTHQHTETRRSVHKTDSQGKCGGVVAVHQAPNVNDLLCVWMRGWGWGGMPSTYTAMLCREAIDTGCTSIVGCTSSWMVPGSAGAVCKCMTASSHHCVGRRHSKAMACCAQGLLVPHNPLCVSVRHLRALRGSHS